MDNKIISEKEIEELRKHYFRLETIKGMAYKRKRQPRKYILLTILTLSWIFFYLAILPTPKFIPAIEVVLGGLSSFVSWTLFQKLNYL